MVISDKLDEPIVWKLFNFIIKSVITNIRDIKNEKGKERNRIKIFKNLFIFFKIVSCK